MPKYALAVNFFIESDADPNDVANAFSPALSGLGGPVLDAARGFPEGEVVGADVDTIRPATEDEVDSHFGE